jgi:hypothetical protein
MCIRYGHDERSSIEASLCRNCVSRGDGHSVDEEGGMWVEFVPGVIGRYAVLAVRICACLLYCSRAESVYADPEGRVLGGASA